MSARVVNLAEFQKRREDASFDRQARALGFANYDALAEFADAEFDAELIRLQAECTHPDKHPDLGMCVACADRMSL